jgi:hypothetical protein
MSGTTQLVFIPDGSGTPITANILYVDPTGNRDLELPPEAESEGAYLVVVNTATGGSSETILVKDDAGAVTIAEIEEDEMAIFTCDGETSVQGTAGWIGGVLATS